MYSLFTHFYIHFLIGSGSECNSVQLISPNTCVCSGDILFYECLVTGGVATVWKGSAFDCTQEGNEITISHARFTQSVGLSCNGTTGAIVANAINSTGSCYTSQLIVYAKASLNGTAIVCVHYAGSEIQVGSYTLLIDSRFIQKYYTIP